MNRSPDEAILIKLGGSLITDKTRPETARMEIIERLAQELARARKSVHAMLVLGHGSGSFGHVSAARSGLPGGIRSPEQRAGVSTTQRAAARLHTMVVEALDRAGALPFSIAPSSAMVSLAGRPDGFHLEPILLAHREGLLPVVYGDVVLDRELGAGICSTETVLATLARHLVEQGIRVVRMLWLGATDGIYDADGSTIPVVSEDNAASVADGLGDPAGTDVTGGMTHRLETARELARIGTPSWILNGEHPGALEDALTGGDVRRTEVRVGN